MTGAFKEAGARLLANGYEIVPIRRGEKRPTLKDWTTLKLDSDSYAKLAASRTTDGVGILTKYTPAIDIDIYNDAVARSMRVVVERRLGVAPMRVGRPPKCLFIFKTDEPFEKITSNSYIDPENPTTSEGKPLKQRIEILGDGQQFVAYHIHPDTGKPYDWPGFEQEPLDVAHDDLIELTVDDAVAICEEFERLVERLEWKKAGSGSASTANDSEVEVLMDDAPPAEEDDEIVRVKSALAVISADCDRDTYLRVLAALKWTQWECGEELAREWAESAPDAFVEKHFVNDWRTLKADRGGRKTATIATIYGLAKDLGWDSSRPVEEKSVEEIKADLEQFMSKAAQLTDNDVAGVTALLRELRDAEISTLTHATIIKEMSKRTKISIPDIKRAFIETRVADEGAPTHWTYAKKLAAEIEDETGVAGVALEGQIFTFNSNEMIWKGRIPEMMSMRVAKNFDGGENCERRGDYVNIAKQLHDFLSTNNEKFFDEAPIGMGCDKRFYSLDDSGAIQREPIAAKHRQRVLFPVSPKVGEMPLFTRFLDETFAGDASSAQRDLLQEIIGATMLGFFHKYEKVVLMKGPGRAGKGTIMKIIHALLPSEIITAIPPDKWEKEYYLAGLAGKRLNLVGELSEEGAIEGAVLKTVSGRDPLTGRVPAQMPFKFTNTATHIFNGNYFPPTRDQSDAFFSRWILLEFRNSMLEHEEDIDEDLAEKIVENELPAISAWAIKGAQRLRERGKIVLPPEHFKLMDIWRKRSNSVIEFLHDDDEVRLGQGENYRVMRSDFYPAYMQWCRESGRKPLGKLKVLELLESPQGRNAGLTMTRSKGVHFIRGMMLRQSAFFGMNEEDDDEI